MNTLIDTNILIYAVDSDCPQHKRATEHLLSLLKSGTPWCLTWGIIYEFMRVTTHPRVFKHPLSSNQAIDFIFSLLENDSVSIISPTDRHLELLKRTIGELSDARGNLFHDIATAVILREYGIKEIVTADTDFLQFKFLTVVNPLLS